MAKSIEERLVHMQGMVLAHSLALKAIMPSVVPDADVRSATGEAIMSALEKLYGESRINHHGHPAFHAAAAEIEDLFPSAPPRAEHDGKDQTG